MILHLGQPLHLVPQPPIIPLQIPRIIPKQLPTHHPKKQSFALQPTLKLFVDWVEFDRVVAVAVEFEADEGFVEFVFFDAGDQQSVVCE